MSYNKERRRIFNARSKNISLCGAGTKCSMVRVFSRFIDRDQSSIPGCVNVPLFFILVIDVRRIEED
uniref:Photosystem I subunit IX n=2 Tax=Paeonia TaxID=13625 RepID=A0A7D5TZA0_PAELC|nr:photosystem I subunit IX [Paeonia suffruticosa]QLI42395.1 photosystem I subunit IX [Paeonia lactiflora]